MLIHSLHQPSTIQKRIKTVIRKGVVVRSELWVDAHGNEYEKRGSQFYLSKPVMVKSHHHHHQPPDFPLEAVWLMCVLLFGVVFTSFMVGCLVGSWRSSKSSVLVTENVRCNKNYS